MKKLALILIVALASNLVAAEDKHDHKIIAGPHGGRMLESTPLHAEFHVQPDKKVSVTFYSESMKAVTPTTQEIKIIAEAPSGKTVLEMTKTAEGFLSKMPLPEGDGYRIVVQIRSDSSSKPQNFRIDYHTELCGSCKHAEYACTCDHSKEGGASGHNH